MRINSLDFACGGDVGQFGSIRSARKAASLIVGDLTKGMAGFCELGAVFGGSPPIVKTANGSR